MRTMTLPDRVLNVALAGVLALAFAALIGVGPGMRSDGASVKSEGLAQLAPATPDIMMAGSVKLDFALPGVYSGTLATPTPDPTPGNAPPDLGSIDLGLQLTQTGCCCPSEPCQVSGYVDLDFTMVFTQEHAIDMPAPTPDVAVGPLVSGTYDGAILTLESETVALATAGKSVTRTASLVGSFGAGAEGRFEGEYRETLWGYGPRPMTVIGTASMLYPPLKVSGDCNDDRIVDAGDISALVLEIFDGDGAGPVDAPEGTYAGSKVGCDANGDAAIDAGDISCAVRVVFLGPCSCGP